MSERPWLEASDNVGGEAVSGDGAGAGAVEVVVDGEGWRRLSTATMKAQTEAADLLKELAGSGEYSDTSVVRRCDPTLKAPGINRLKVNYDKMLLNFSFIFNLRRCTVGRAVQASASWAARSMDDALAVQPDAERLLKGLAAVAASEERAVNSLEASNTAAGGAVQVTASTAVGQGGH